MKNVEDPIRMLREYHYRPIRTEVLMFVGSYGSGMGHASLQGMHTANAVLEYDSLAPQGCIMQPLCKQR